MHNSLQSPSQDPGYRFLSKGEILKEGDEYWFAFDREWVPARVTLGLDVDEESVGRFRRRKDGFSLVTGRDFGRSIKWARTWISPLDMAIRRLKR